MSATKLTISRIDVYAFDIPMIEPFKIALMTSHEAKNILVKITTNEGLIGWGEGSPLHSVTGETQDTCLAVAKTLAPSLLGKNPLEIGERVREMDALVPHNTTAKSAFDIAFHDLAAKVAQMPLYLFLGGTARPMRTDITIAMGTPERAAKKAEQARVDGFDAIKTKVGLDLECDRKSLENIRKAMGDNAHIRIDANQGWDRCTAVKALNEWQDLNLEFCEQPVKADDLDGLKYVSTKANIPIMADESCFSQANAIEIIKRQAAPYLNIKLSKAGGIWHAMRIAAIGEASRHVCMIGCMLESSIALTASAHFAAACPIIRFFDLDSIFSLSVQPTCGGMSVERGHVTLPDSPGLGVEPDQDFLKRLKTESWS